MPPKNEYLSDEQKEDLLKRIVDYLSTHDFFWSTDMRASLNIVYSNASTNPRRTIIDAVMRRLSDRHLLGTSEVRKTEKQYYLLGRPITLNDLK